MSHREPQASRESASAPEVAAIRDRRLAEMRNTVERCCGWQVDRARGFCESFSCSDAAYLLDLVAALPLERSRPDDTGLQTADVDVVRSTAVREDAQHTAHQIVENLKVMTGFDQPGQTVTLTGHALLRLHEAIVAALTPAPEAGVAAAWADERERVAAFLAEVYHREMSRRVIDARGKPFTWAELKEFPPDRETWLVVADLAMRLDGRREGSA